MERIEQKIRTLDYSRPYRLIRSVNSYLGIMQHTSSYKIRRRLLMKAKILRYGVFSSDMSKFTDRMKYRYIRRVNP